MAAQPKGRIPTAGVLAAVLGVSLGIVAAGGSASPDGERANPPVGSGGGLKKIQKTLGQALKAGPGTSEFDKLVKEAVVAKRRWIEQAFGSQTVSGCSAAFVLIRFDAIDVEVEAAAKTETPEQQERNIKNAIGSANAVAAETMLHRENCPGAVQSEVDLAKQIFDLVQDLPGDKPPSEKARKKIAAAKALFLLDGRVYGCDAVEYLTALEGIDIPLAVATDLSASEGNQGAQKRLVKEAKSEVKRFRRYWRLVPCDEPGTGTTTTTTDTGTGPQTTTTTTTTSTTTTTTPGSPEKCDDGVDNDGDGSADGDDIDCRSGPGGAFDPLDTDESGDLFGGLTCPPPPTSGSKTFTVVDPSTGDVIHHRLFLNAGVLIDSDKQTGTATIPAGQFGNPCPDSEFTVSWTTHQGPPPPGQAADRDVVEYEITISGSASGGGTFSVRPVQDDRHATSALGLSP
jgi:hypothetical protein